MNDAKAERAILATVYQHDMTDMLHRLDKEDFVDPLHVLIICELKNMDVAGEPFDPVAMARWFTQDRVVARARTTKIQESIGDLTAEVLTDYASVANAEYYYGVIRNERLRRAIHRLSLGLESKNKDEPRNPVKTLEWARMNIERLIEKGLTPEKVSAKVSI